MQRKIPRLLLTATWGSHTTSEAEEEGNNETLWFRLGQQPRWLARTLLMFTSSQWSDSLSLFFSWSDSDLSHIIQEKPKCSNTKSFDKKLAQTEGGAGGERERGKRSETNVKREEPLLTHSVLLKSTGGKLWFCKSMAEAREGQPRKERTQSKDGQTFVDTV